jgi:spermine oxidase
MWTLRNKLNLISSLIIILIEYVVAQNKAKVVIVGAGLSGCSAFNILMNNDERDVVVLEAENRIGGRIWSIPFSNGMIDLGGQWITGERGNVIFEMVKANGSIELGQTNVEAGLDFYDSHGNKPLKVLTNYLTELGDEILSDYGGMLKFNGSLGHFFLDRFWKDESVRWIHSVKPEITYQIIDYFEYYVNNWNGSECWFDVSSGGNAIFGFNDGSQYVTWRDKGFFTFFEFLLGNINDSILSRTINDVIDGRLLRLNSQIKLNTKVVNIDYDLNDKNSKIIVTTSTGETWEADHVIWTGSLGVLKRYHRDIFEPDLPPRQIEAIEKMGFGTFGKVFLEFTEPFWPTNTSEWATYDFLWFKDDMKHIKCTNREWILSMRQISYVDGFPNVLEAELGGKGFEEFETLSDEEVEKAVLWVLRKFLKREIPKPINMKKTQWKTKENFWGSYSYESVAAYDAGILPSTLCKNIYVEDKPTILFAGEACHDVLPGLTQGAVMSGFDEAKEILKFYGKMEK